MVDAIGSASTGWAPASFDDDDEVRRRAAAVSTTKVATAPPEVPDGPGISGALLVRAAQAQAGAPPAPAAGPKMLLAMGVDATSTATPDKDTAVQGRMNAFFESAVPTYRIPPEGQGQVGQFVKVATPFQMVSHTDVPPGTTDTTTLAFAAHEKSVEGHAKELIALGAAKGMRPGDVAAVIAGRGTPGQVRTLTQALLDAKKLPDPIAGESADVRVRRMMCSYGIGFDCAGFTQQAFLAAHGATRAQAGLDPDITKESLSRLDRAHFTTVAPEAARAGDIMALGPRDPKSNDVGHRVIVFDRHDASPEELAQYCGSGPASAMAKGRVSVLSVDSSFGSGGVPAWGGVQRQTWLYDADSKQWGRVIPPSAEGGRLLPGKVITGDQPYDAHHRLLGIYHYKGNS